MNLVKETLEINTEQGNINTESTPLEKGPPGPTSLCVLTHTQLKNKHLDWTPYCIVKVLLT